MLRLCLMMSATTAPNDGSSVFTAALKPEGRWQVDIAITQAQLVAHLTRFLRSQPFEAKVILLGGLSNSKSRLGANKRCPKPSAGSANVAMCYFVCIQEHS